MSWEAVSDSLSRGHFPGRIRGNFAFVWNGLHETVAAVDHVCTFPLFYSKDSISPIFSALFPGMPQIAPNEKTAFQIEFLGGQSIGAETTVKGIDRLLPGHYLRAGVQTPYLDPFVYAGDEPLDPKYFTGLIENTILGLIRPENALLISGGTDSTALAAVARKLGLLDKFHFIHAYSDIQALSEKELVEDIAAEMGLPVKFSHVKFSGDIMPDEREKQFSFWIENPFLGKKMAIAQHGLGKARIFTGELGDQLFGGPKNNALLAYALQVKRPCARELAALWINLSATYGRESGFQPCARIRQIIQNNSTAADAHEELIEAIASMFLSIKGKDFLHRVMLLNYLVKGPYRTWAYSQDGWDWVHPFSSWEIFDYAFRLKPSEKLGEGGLQKDILRRLWQPYLSELPWKVPKHGFGIPAVSKLRRPPERQPMADGPGGFI